MMKVSTLKRMVPALIVLIAGALHIIVSTQTTIHKKVIRESIDKESESYTKYNTKNDSIGTTLNSLVFLMFVLAGVAYFIIDQIAPAEVAAAVAAPAAAAAAAVPRPRPAAPAVPAAPAGVGAAQVGGWLMSKLFS